MKTIYFIISNHFTHENVLENGSGASEYLFYSTANFLSKYLCINHFIKTLSNNLFPTT